MSGWSPISRCLGVVVALLTPASLLAQSELTQTQLIILVPVDAVVYIDDIQMQSTGTERLFATPPLTVGGWYVYRVVVWEEGQSLQREVRFQAGQTVRVDFRPQFRQLWNERRNERPTRPIRPWVPERRWWC